jgi:DNA-binding NarL/FixJ family response regulator
MEHELKSTFPYGRGATKLRLLLADDHKLVLEGLRKILEPEFEVAGTVEDGRALLAAAAQLRPDAILVDIAMPLLNGIDAARQLRHIVPEAKVIFVTMHAERAYILAAADVGAAGYVLKRSLPKELLAAVRAVIAGERFLAPSVGLEAAKVWNRAGRRARPRVVLTARQREVLQLAAEGKSNKEIAAVLNITVKSVEFHKASISRTLCTTKRAELTRYAVQQGLVSP